MKSDISGQKREKPKKKTVDVRWIAFIFICTMIISGVFSFVANALLGDAVLGAAFAILLVIILIGIIFDVIGVAVTAADPKPFHSMAAHRVHGAQEALGMLKNADKVSSFCNDVVGDICGVISGTASASIVLIMFTESSGGTVQRIAGIAMAALVSGLTVGGKAIGKSLAITKATIIVHTAALTVYYVKAAPRMISKIFKRKK